MYNDNKIYSRGRIIENRVMDVRRSIVMNEITGERALLSFQTPLVRLIETSSQYLLSSNSEIFKAGEDYNDFYGFFSSVEEPILNAVARNLKPTDAIKCEVWTSLDHKLVAPAPEDEICIGGDAFILPPSDWIIIGDGPNTDERILEWHTTPWMERFPISPKFVNDDRPERILVWSSQNDADTNRNLYLEIVNRFVAMRAIDEITSSSMMAQYDKEMTAA